MLKALKDLRPEDAQRVLLELTQDLLPQPEHPSHVRGEVHARALAELFRSSTAPTEIDPGIIPASVFETLVAEITAQLLPEPRKQAARDRLGERGELRVDLMTFVSAGLRLPKHAVCAVPMWKAQSGNPMQSSILRVGWRGQRTPLHL
jgi:hypothetical protein